MIHRRTIDSMLCVATTTLALTCACAGLDATAQTPVTMERTSLAAHDIGDATRTWLALQRTNAAAAPALPTPGAQATLAYARYMNSFETKIPDSFGSTLTGQGGAGTPRTGYANGDAAAQPSGAN